jgi:hypothetical protein
MDLFTTLRIKKGASSLRSSLLSDEVRRTARVVEVVQQKAKKPHGMLYNSKKRIILLLERVFHRKKWLSIQFFSFGSLVNQYLAVLNAQNELARQKKLVQFTTNATSTLKRYKGTVYKRYKKALAKKKRRKTPSLNSIERAAEVIYNELKLISGLYQRKLQWMRIMDSAKTLIRDSVGRS